MLNYAPGSPERAKLVAALEKMKKQCPEIGCVVNGKEVKTGKIDKQVMPSDHQHVLCTFHEATKQTVTDAIDGALNAKKHWESLPFESRAAVFLKAADLLSSKYRAEMCAAVMLGQGKTAWQAEIDAAAEQADFWRFNAKYAEEIYSQQPTENSQFVWNKQEYRALEGFLLAVTPFNFAAIGSNLASAPAQMGNVVLWKPSGTSMLANRLSLQILHEAGLPEGVIQFLPGPGPLVSEAAFAHKEFAGLHFTGSTGTFNHLWRQIGQNLEGYRSYPRIVGETGGKNFHFVHPTAPVRNVVLQTVRSAFEYNGQKCSACSRIYVPDNLWPEIREQLLAETAKLTLGQPDDLSVFTSAVIDRKAFDRIKSTIDRSKADTQQVKLLAGGECDDSKGFFVRPTIFEVKDAQHSLLKDEIFGPVLAVHVYPAGKWEQTLEVVADTASYALTGAIFARDPYAIQTAQLALRHAAGNFYINDKSTGAVVGQQPFGGGRKSGTNDKSGSALNLLRWTSVRSIKETFMPIEDWSYPHMRS